MEAVRDFRPFQDTDQDTDQARGQAGYSGVQYALDVLQGVSSTAVADAAFWGFQAASDFAGSVEEFPRTLEYLQVVAAAKEATGQERTLRCSTDLRTCL